MEEIISLYLEKTIYLKDDKTGFNLFIKFLQEEKFTFTYGTKDESSDEPLKYTMSVTFKKEKSRRFSYLYKKYENKIMEGPKTLYVDYIVYLEGDSTEFDFFIKFLQEEKFFCTNEAKGKSLSSPLKSTISMTFKKEKYKKFLFLCKKFKER